VVVVGRTDFLMFILCSFSSVLQLSVVLWCNFMVKYHPQTPSRAKLRDSCPNQRIKEPAQTPVKLWQGRLRRFLNLEFSICINGAA
jgi:hypothetical protein